MIGYPNARDGCVPQENNVFFLHIINPLLTKLACSVEIVLVLCEFRGPGLGQYPAILTSRLVDNSSYEWHQIILNNGKKVHNIYVMYYNYKVTLLTVSNLSRWDLSQGLFPGTCPNSLLHSLQTIHPDIHTHIHTSPLFYLGFTRVAKDG